VSQSKEDAQIQNFNNLSAFAQVESTSAMAPMPAAAAKQTPVEAEKDDDFVYVRKDNWGYAGHLTPDQEKCLQAMRDNKYSCTESEAGTWNLDDDCLLRFCRARKFDLKKADKMFTAHLVRFFVVFVRSPFFY
jgi:hypothetical protein